MLKRARLLCIAFAFVAAVGLAEAPKLPPPRDGFAWEWCDDVRVGVLRPANWHLKSQTRGVTHSYFISKEDINSAKKFETGVTLNVVQDVGKNSGGTASAYAVEIVKGLIRDRKNVLKIIPPGDVGPAKSFGCRIKKDGSVMHYFLLADDRHDKLYLFIFESPENEWENAWKVGEQILRQLQVEFPED